MPPSTVQRPRLSRRPFEPFAFEAEMTAVAAAGWRCWWPGQRPPDFVAVEVVAPGATADLVAGAFDYVAVGARRSAGIEPVTDWTGLLCAFTCATARTATEVAGAVGLSTSGARRSLAVAVASGAVLRDGRHFTVNPAWRPALTRLVAVELKLRDWQKGLVQAQRYRRWADASWLILGAASLAPAAAAPEAGVGLARLGRDGAWAKLRTAKRVRPTYALERRWAEEQVLAQALRAGWRLDRVTAPGATFVGAPAVATG